MATAPTPPPVDPSALSAPPSPALGSAIWDSIQLGAFKFPPVPGQDGVARLDLDSEIKVDTQKASGKDKAKTKINGVEPVKGTLELEWTEAIWDAAAQFVMAIDPNGPNAGLPLAIIHPKAQMRRLASVLVHKADKLDTSKPGLFTQKFTIEEWVDPETADADAGTNTPSDDAKWTPSYGGKSAGGASAASGANYTVPAGSAGDTNNAWTSSRGPSAAP